MEAAHEFWTGDSEYQELAMEFERNIEVTHPGAVTSQGMCVCLEFTSYCSWAATNVTYREYRGPRVVNL